MQSYLQMPGGKQLAIKQDCNGKYRLVDIRTKKCVMAGFATVREAVYWTKIDWN